MPILSIPLALLALPGQGDSPSGAVPAFGDFRAELRGLAEPSAAAVDAGGTIWIAERFGRRVARFSPAGEALGRLDLAARGVPCEPVGLALGPGGTVLVSDAAQHAILVLDRAGARQRQIGRRGAGAGELREPRGIAVAGERVFVADSGNHRVAVFDVGGRFVRAFGQRGTGPGELLAPHDVAVDEAGAVFVADLGNQRIARFSAEGEFETAWGGIGPHAGLFQAPTSVECLGASVLVADRDNHRVQIFDRDGRPLSEWGEAALVPREGGGKLHDANGIAVAPDGSFAVVLEGQEDRAQLFGPLARPPQLAPPERPAAHYEGGAAAYGERLAVLEPSGPTVALFDLSRGAPIEVTRFGSFGAGPGRLIDPAGVAFDPSGESVWIADPLAQRISQFRVAREIGAPLRFEPFLARFVRALDLERLEGLPRGSWPSEPCSIAFTPQGELVIADRANVRLIVLDMRFEYLRTIGAYGDKPGQFRDAGALAVSEDGAEVWVCDARLRRVHVFHRDGGYIATRKLPDLADGAWRPSGLAPDGARGMWCSAEDGHALFRIAGDGTVRAALGRPATSGLGALEFFKPAGLARSPDGRLFAVDAGNHRFQIVSPKGVFLDAFGARFYVAPALQAPGGAR